MGLRGSAGLHTQVTGSPEIATETAGHGGSDLRKDWVTRVLPDSLGLAHGRGSKLLGSSGSAPSLLISDSPSLDLSVSLSISLSLSLKSLCVCARRKKEEERRRREKVRKEEGRRAGCVGSVESESQGESLG
jgi:hypothetical protein